MRRLLWIALALPLALAAHEGELHKAAKEAKAAVGQAGKAVAASVKEAQTAVGSAGKEAAAKVKEVLGVAVAQIEPLDLVKQQARAHWHNKLVHFPIALGLAGALFLIAGGRWPGAKAPGRWLLFLAGLAGLGAIFTGLSQEGEYDGTSLVKALEAHENAGKFTVGLMWACWLLSFFESAKRWSWLAYLALAGFILLVAGLGGAIAHA